MGSIYFAAQLDVPAGVAWDYLDRFTRAEVLPFSSSAAGRREGEYRVVTMPGGQVICDGQRLADPVTVRKGAAEIKLGAVTAVGTQPGARLARSRLFL